MPYTLYGCRRSGSLFVELALAEIGCAYEVRQIDLQRDVQRADDYAAINPQRKLPTLLTAGGETLSETVAIALTLDERHPHVGLLPPCGSVERAQALRTLLFVATEIYPIVEINDYPERFSPRPADNDAVRKRARAIWRERWLLVEQSIAGEPFLLPGGFCVTDLYIAVVSRWAQQDDWRPAHIPKVERLTAAVATRPTLQQTWLQHRPEAAPRRCS